MSDVADRGRDVTLAAWYQNLRDTQDNPPLFRQLVADFMAKADGGDFDGAGCVPDCPAR